MRIYALMATICFLLAPQALVGAGANDDYIRIYGLVKQGDQLFDRGDSEAAATQYLEARRQLLEFQKTYPAWNKAVVEFRLKYLAENLESIPRPEPDPGPASVTAPSSVGARQNTIPADVRNQILALNDRIKQLHDDNTLLDRKLREALKARPAEVDSVDIQRAEENIRRLQKEKELLEVSLQRALSENSVQDGEPSVQQIEASLAEARRTIVDQRVMIERLRAEVASPTEPTPAESGDAVVQELMTENARLRRQLSENALTPPEVASENIDRIQELTRERDRLQNELAKLQGKGSGESSKGWWPFNRKSGKSDVDWLQARLTAYEAEKEPFSPEELALMKESEPVLSTETNIADSANTTLPAEAALMEAEAQQAARSGNWAAAEAKFQEIVGMDPNHASLLASLALTQIAQGKLNEAEQNLVKALGEEPNNSYAMFQMGRLKFEQKEIKRAIEWLSRASELDVTDPEIQNQLGIALSQSGQRGPAEAALRKAVKLRPGYVDAHFNLAVVYATQDPPFAQLANYHYQIAVRGGKAADSRLEQLIASAMN